MAGYSLKPACSIEGCVSGQVAEWLKAHAWKACIRQKRIGGSNPPLSATSGFTCISVELQKSHNHLN